MRYSSRADLSPWFCTCPGSVTGLRLETALPAGLKPTLCEAPREPGRRLPERPPAARGLARILNSEVALYRQRGAEWQPLQAIASWGLGPVNDQVARSHEGGVVGRALGAKPVALGPLVAAATVSDAGRRMTASASQPRDSQRSISMRIPGGDDAPTRARRSVHAQLDGHIPATAASYAALLVSELVSNSVVHANVGRSPSADRGRHDAR